MKALSKDTNYWPSITLVLNFARLDTGTLISSLRELMAKREVSVPVSNLAKFKTFIQMFSIALLLTGETGNKISHFQDYNAQTIGIILLWL